MNNNSTEISVEIFAFAVYFFLVMLRLFVIALCLVSCYAQSNPPAKSWPSAWNATVSITMGDIVVGAPANTFYDASRQMQATFFSQCGIAGGLLNNEPCIQVQSSVSDNFGVGFFPDLFPIVTNIFIDLDNYWRYLLC